MRMRYLTFLLLAAGIAAGMFLIVSTAFPASATAALPKPINGTFLMLDFPTSTPTDWDDYFTDLKEMGMNTVVLLSMGFLDGPSNTQSDELFANKTIENILASAHTHGFQVYLGLAASRQGIDYWMEGSATNPNTPLGKIAAFNLSLISRVKELAEAHGWGWKDNFIQGFYIPQELRISRFKSAEFGFYSAISSSIKAVYPDKLIMISPW